MNMNVTNNLPLVESYQATLLKNALMMATILLGAAAATDALSAQVKLQNDLQHLETQTSQMKPGTPAYVKLLQDAEKFIKQGNPAAALALLEPHEFALAGNEQFDYLLGIAALDSGQPDKATFALERVLLVSPASIAARLDMARAYYQLGDFARAKTEFNLVLKQNPSRTARSNIENYLDEIALKENNNKARLSGYIRLGIGHDSNVNNASSLSQIYVDTLATTATLDPTNLQAADNYAAVGGGAAFTYHVNPNWSSYVAADFLQRKYSSQTNFNAQSLDGRIGLRYSQNNETVNLGLNNADYLLGNAQNYTAKGINAEWQHKLNPLNQLNLVAQHTQFRFADILLQPNDYDLTLLGVGLQHLAADGNAKYSIGIYQGRENDTSTLANPPASPNGGRTDGAKMLGGLRLGYQITSGNTSLFAHAGMQLGEYDKTNYWFQRKRSDRFYDMTLGANWHWNKHWSLQPQLTYAINESNIEIYSFNRMDASLNIRRDFR